MTRSRCYRFEEGGEIVGKGDDLIGMGTWFLNGCLVSRSS